MADQRSNKLSDLCKLDNCTIGPLITDNVAGEVLCGRCGLVLVEKVEDSGPEHLSHTPEEYAEHSRTGGATSLKIHDRGLATVIGSADRDASGKLLSSDLKYAFKRLRLWDSRNQSRGNDRPLKKAFVMLDTLQTKLAIPDVVVEKAAYIFRKALAKKMTSGRNISSLISASLYTACREANTPRTLNDIANAANIRKKDLSRTYRLLIKDLDLKVEPYNSSEFITRISNRVGISEKTRRDALNIISKAVEKEFSAGKNPLGLAATALYLSCMMNGERKTQDDIAKAAGVTAVTIRNRCASLRKDLNITN